MEARGNTTYEEFLREILRPTNYTSLKDPLPPESYSIQILVFTNSSGTPTNTISINNLYPFQTISDLSTRIYIESGERDEYHPENQCLLRPSEEGTYTHFQYVFGNENIVLKNPYTFLQTNKPDSRFVDLTGNPKLVKFTPRSQLLLETTLFEQKSKVLHLFLYRNFYEAYSGMKPINRTDWEGIFRPYFPEHDKEHEDGSLTAEAESYKATLVKRLTCRQQMIELLDEHLENSPLRKPGESTRGDSVNLSNIRNLRFLWKRPNYSKYIYKAFDLESIFYDTQVSKDIPYIRYYPKTAEPISKLHVEGPINIPSLERPEILLQWSELKTLSPDENLMMMKILLRPGSGSVNPLYATMYIHQDGSAKFIIQPDMDTKALTRQGDLFNLGEILTRVTESLPKLYPILPTSGAEAKTLYTANTIMLEDAYIVLSLWLGKEDTDSPITKKSLETVLPFYRPFFQVSASPLQFQHPIAFLRYKGIDNFQMPSRDFQFLHRVLDLQKLQGRASIANLVPYYMEQFDVPESVAQTRITSFLSDLTKFELVDPVTLEYKQATNPGIDIAIFGKAPYYTVHIYRVNSLVNLRRIKSLLSLLISIPVEEFEEIRKCDITVAKEDEEQQENADNKANEDAAEGNEVSSPAIAIAAAKSVAADAFQSSEQGFAYDGLGDFAGFGEETATPPLTEVPPLKTLAALEAPEEANGEAEESEDEEQDDDMEEITDVSQLKRTKAKTYFLKRLNFYDKRLFQYTKTHPSLKKYSSMCAANALKQPVVLSEDEFIRMKEIYEDDVKDGKLLWIEYPLKSGQTLPEPESKDTEIITVLRYGSNLLAGQANIYICSQYWCRQDDIVVLATDFESTKDRKGRPKDKNTCPFCRGGPIKNRLDIVKGETVIDRSGKEKSMSKKRHLFVRFLKKTVHPEGLYLPCCFLKDKKGGIFEESEPAYSSIKALAQRATTGEPVVASMTQQQEEEPIVQHEVDYKKKLGNTKSWYIVGAEKLPLEVLVEGPQIGILPESVDKFFAQDSLKDLVVNDHTVWKLITKNGLPNASGFLRIAVENKKRYQPESFLAAIAPFYGENSVAGIKRRILEFIQPILFMSLNYGNFLFDFFDPTTPTPPPFVLREFAVKRLMLDQGIGIQKEAVVRAWKGFKAFEAFMGNTSKTKEFRHFAKFLTLPNLLYWEDKDKSILANGIIFIILEVSSKDSSLEVRCPPYGISPADAARCDVGFIIHYTSGIWEPVIYTNNDASPQHKKSETYMVFRRDAQAGWPSIVKKRVQEYEAMCHSSGLGIYTDSMNLSSNTLLPISKVIQIQAAQAFPRAILRDTYNHVSSVLFRIDTGFVLVPVIDDGSVYPNMNIELDWRNFMRDLAPGSAAVQFYETTLKALLDTQPQEISNSYMIQNIIRLDKTVPDRSDIYALHLANGLIVPVRKPEGKETILESDILEEGQEAPWSIDTKLVFGSKEPVARIEMNFQEFEEIYQHLRYTFANWYALQPPGFKEEINEILFKNGKVNNTLPLYEKRQRLFIKLNNEILSWLDSSIPQRERNPSLKRVDCRIIRAADQCTNRCVWKADVNSCLLHTPETYDIGTKNVDAKGLMIKKLIEELIRFPLKRTELLSKKVNQYIKLTGAFRSGNQYILPESSYEWSELLRFEWTKDVIDEPKYAEEFTAITPQSIPKNSAPIYKIAPIPELLEKYINDKKTSTLKNFKQFKR